MKIVIDAFGGDNAPQANIEGALLAINKYKDLKIVLIGKEKILKDYLSQKKYVNDQIEIINADDVITNDDSPAESIRSKTNSSIVVAYEYLRNNEDCIGIVSAGSSGAVLSGALLKLGRIKGINRPALSPLLPNKQGKSTLLIDCGANVDCKVENLCQFAVMGTIYYKQFFGIDNPRVALLNVGVEDKKGNEFYKEVFKELKKLPINFVGNMEARYALSGDYDIIVCDGFDGNILLKSIEGSFSVAKNELKKIFSKNIFSKIGYLFVRKSLKKFISNYDYNKYGGAPFLGTKKTVIKSHGSSKPITICAAIEQIIMLEEKNVNKLINQEFATKN